MIILNGGAFFLGTGYFSDGSAVAPSLAFASEPGTGFFKYGANVIGYSANGTASLLFSSVGRIFSSDVACSVTLATGGLVTFSGSNLYSAAQLILKASFADSANGKIQLDTHTTSAGGIGFGTDLSLFRFSATTLRLSAAANSYFSVDGPAANEVGFGYTKAGSTIWVSYVPSAGSTDLRWNNGSDRWLMNSAGQFLGITPTGGLGYGAGSGGTVTQITSKATAVTLSKVCGTISTHNASLAANTAVSFTLTNTAIAATDSIVFNVSAATAGAYIVNAQCGAGSATIELRNVTAGALAEAVAIRFAVIKSVNA